jgi:hypothetical protein
MLMMTSFFTPCHTQTNKRNQSSHKVSKLPMAVPEIVNKIVLLENKFVYLDQEEILGDCGRRTCESSVQF